MTDLNLEGKTLIHRSGKVTVWKARKKKRRGLIWINPEASRIINQSQTKRYLRRMLWRLFNKEEIIGFINVECPQRSVSMRWPKLLMIKEWIDYGNPDENTTYSDFFEEYASQQGGIAKLSNCPRFD